MDMTALTGKERILVEVLDLEETGVEAKLPAEAEQNRRRKSLFERAWQYDWDTSGAAQASGFNWPARTMNFSRRKNSGAAIVKSNGNELCKRRHLRERPSHSSNLRFGV